MGILQITTEVTGLVGVHPNIVYIQTDDTVAEVTATGYLNHVVEQQGHIFNNTQMALVYTTDSGCDWYQITVTTTNASLVLNVSPGDVLLPVAVNRIAIFTNTSGQIGDPTGAVAHLGSIIAGNSGTAGTFISFPATAGNGALILAGVDAGGAFNTTISNGTMGQATVYTIPDVVSATGRFLVGATATPFTANHSLVASGTGGLIADAGYQMKTVAGAAAAGGAAAQSFTDAFCTAGSNVVGNWNTQANAASVLKIVPGVGSFVVTSSADAGVGTFNYIITKV